MQELMVTKGLATPVNVIVHSYADVNDRLAPGLPFFADIARDRVVLYEAEGVPLGAGVNFPGMAANFSSSL